jgi:hypothetical protein
MLMVFSFDNTNFGQFYGMGDTVWRLSKRAIATKLNIEPACRRAGKKQGVTNAE